MLLQLLTFLSIFVSRYLGRPGHVLHHPGDAVEGGVAEVALGGAHVLALDPMVLRLRGGWPRLVNLVSNH